MSDQSDNDENDKNVGFLYKAMRRLPQLNFMSSTFCTV